MINYHKTSKTCKTAKKTWAARNRVAAGKPPVGSFPQSK